MRSKLYGFHSRAILWTVSAVLAILTLPITDTLSMIPVLEEKGGKHCLPDYDRERAHDDYLWGFKWIPRSATVFCGASPPTVLAGNLHGWHVRFAPDLQKGPPRVAEPSEWYIAYTSIILKDGRETTCYIISYTSPFWHHLRYGNCGWDDQDNLYSVPSVAVKVITLPYETLLFHWHDPFEKAFLR